MRSVFLNYRRNDESGIVGWLRSEASRLWGDGDVFFDQLIPPGEEWVDELKSRIRDCDLFIAIIGPRWAAEGTGENLARLHDPKDMVRCEIEWALKWGRKCMPLRVNNAALPDPSVLPKSLRPLLEFQDDEISVRHFQNDILRLLNTITGKRFRSDELTDPPCIRYRVKFSQTGSKILNNEILWANSGGVRMLGCSHEIDLLGKDVRWAVKKLTEYMNEGKQEFLEDQQSVYQQVSSGDKAYAKAPAMFKFDHPFSDFRGKTLMPWIDYDHSVEISKRSVLLFDVKYIRMDFGQR